MQVLGKQGSQLPPVIGSRVQVAEVGELDDRDRRRADRSRALHRLLSQ
jgi:hypothetical protein